MPVPLAPPKAEAGETRRSADLAARRGEPSTTAHKGTQRDTTGHKEAVPSWCDAIRLGGAEGALQMQTLTRGATSAREPALRRPELVAASGRPAGWMTKGPLLVWHTSNTNRVRGLVKFLAAPSAGPRRLCLDKENRPSWEIQSAAAVGLAMESCALPIDPFNLLRHSPLCERGEGLAQFGRIKCGTRPPFKALDAGLASARRSMRR